MTLKLGGGSNLDCKIANPFKKERFNKKGTLGLGTQKGDGNMNPAAKLFTCFVLPKTKVWIDWLKLTDLG